MQCCTARVIPQPGQSTSVINLLMQIVGPWSKKLTGSSMSTKGIKTIRTL